MTIRTVVARVSCNDTFAIQKTPRHLRQCPNGMTAVDYGSSRAQMTENSAGMGRPVAASSSRPA